LHLFLHLLGGFHLYHGQILDVLNIRHQLLLAYLALHATQAIPRSELAFKLWADSSEEQALTNLRKALYHLKQIGDFIQTDAHTLQLNQKIQLDITDFVAALDSAERARVDNPQAEQTALETATAFYKGDLLPSLYEDWLIPERERLRNRFIQATDRLIALLEARQHYRDAIKHAQRLLQTDNLREDTYRTLIRLHALNNDRAAALNVYHTCAGILSKELGVEPDSSTRELYERLLKSEAQPIKINIPVRPISTPLVAREQEWKKLLSEWKKASNGELRTFLLSGEAGIGKTRLAEELLDWASRQGIRTAFAASYSAEGQISFAPVAGWLRSMPLQGLDMHWQNELARVLPELRNNAKPQPMTENWQKQIFFEAMARALLAENEPLILLLDDIQWCDNDTLDWLRYFLHFDKTAKIFILVTLRGEELPSNKELQLLLVDLRAEGQLTEMELSRLDEKQTAELGAHLLGRNFSQADSLPLFRESEGVPLFVVELANAGIRVESVYKAEAGAGEKETGLPPRLQAILEGRLARLSSPSRAVIESAAVIGREFDFDLLQKTSELDEIATVNALDELWRVRMIRERGGRYDFSHDKLREATLKNISPMRMRWLHQRVGDALEVEHAEADYARIADHFEHAGKQAKASEYYARAAGYSGQLFAFDEALEYYRRAILLETQQAILADLYEGRGDVLKVQGRSEDAFQAFEQAFGLADTSLPKARLARKQISLTSRHAVDVAQQKYAVALEEIQQVEPDARYRQEWIELQFAWIQALYWKLDADGMDALLAQTHELVELYGTPEQKIHQAHRVINSGFIRELGRLDVRYLEIARENIVRAETLGDSHLISTTRRTYSMAALFAERFDECVAAFVDVIAMSENNGDIGSLLIARVYISLAHRRMKDIEAVRVDTQALLDMLQKVGKNPEYKGIAEANLAWLAYHEYRKKDALQHAQTACELWRAQPTVYSVQWGGVIILFALAVENGQVESALEHTRAVLAPSQQRLRLDVEAALLAVLETDPTDKELSLRLCREAVDVAKKAGYL